jgi:hypothetical protein
VIITSFILLILINFIHAFCFFHLLGSVGATTTGVLKGAQTVLVFILSHFAFCSVQISQCFTVQKGISVIVVVLGVLGYSYYNMRSGGPLSPKMVTTSASFAFTVPSPDSSTAPYTRIP